MKTMWASSPPVVRESDYMCCITSFHVTNHRSFSLMQQQYHKIFFYEYSIHAFSAGIMGASCGQVIIFKLTSEPA